MPECRKCHQPVIWNPEYFEEKKKPKPDFTGLKPILNEDGSDHYCVIPSTRNYSKKFFILPGYEYLDFYQLSLLLGPRIDGFLSRGGISLCRNENQRIISLKIKISKSSLPFQLKYLTKPYLLEIPAQGFSQRINKGDPIKIKCSMRDSIIFSKDFKKISLRNFMGFHFCLGEFKQYKIINFETKERLKPSKIVLLLLKNKGIDIIGDHKQLILNSDKKTLFGGK